MVPVRMTSGGCCSGARLGCFEDFDFGRVGEVSDSGRGSTVRLDVEDSNGGGDRGRSAG